MVCARRVFGAGAVGLSLSYALPLTGLLNGLLTSSAETEQEMVAVERVLEYSDVKPQVHSPSDAACLRSCQHGALAGHHECSCDVCFSK